MEELLTVKELSKAYKVADSTIRNYINEGLLIAYTVGKRTIRIRKSDAEALVKLKQPSSFYFRSAPESC